MIFGLITADRKDMYAQHFGLKKRPFRATVAGRDVFVGPQIAATMAGLKKGLAGNDAIVTVSGPVGSGKTTLVKRALESIGNQSSIIHVARMSLDSDDVLEFLLDELGVQDRPSGTIQRFSLFRRRLKELQDEGSRVFISVEDTHHLGAETLAELEALTSADAGESEGAGIVLMGDERLEKFVSGPGLARMKQRIRQRHTIAPLIAAELRGYLRHCFRLAGKDFEQVFEANAAPLIHHLSNGIARIANNLVESAMTAAADQDASLVSSELIARIAENEYGLSAAGFDLTEQPPTPAIAPAPPVAEAKPEPVVELSAAPEPELPPCPEPDAEVPAEPEPVLEDIPELPVEEPVIVFAEPAPGPAADPVSETTDQDDIPELIQDTLPDLQILAPHLAAAAAEPLPEPRSEPEPEIAAEPAPIPELRLDAEPQMELESTGIDVPAWDRDPTMAELKPDIAALEEAMAFSQSDEPAPVADDSDPIPEPEPEEPEVIPEITLDHAISQRIESTLIDEKGEVSAPNSENVSASARSEDTSALNVSPKANKKADAEIEKIASELAKAKSIEDMDDRMAETLFGDEINFVAAQMLANSPTADDSANDDNNGADPGEHVPNGSPAPKPEVAAKPDVEVTLQAPPKLDGGGMDLSASQRLKTVRALNADLQPSIHEPETNTSGQSADEPTGSPESIEDQINTSMTQTLKALNVRPPVNDDDMDDEDRKGGFFSRFKRP